MSEKAVYRVFVSYTAHDLAGHADVVVSVLRKLQMIAVDHRDSGATGEPSVEWCLHEVDRADLLVVLLAHRYGWVPTAEEGGDGEKCITWLEVARARSQGKILLPYLVDELAAWSPTKIEALQNPSVLPKLQAFRTELSRSVAAFFTAPESLDGPVSRDVPRAIERLTSAIAAPSRTVARMDEQLAEGGRRDGHTAIEALKANRRDEARVHLLNALRRFHEITDRGTRRSELGVFASLLEQLGFPSLALAVAADAIELDEALDDRRHLAEDILTRGNACVRLSIPEEAERAYRWALEVSLLNGDYGNAASASTNLAAMLGNRGRLKEALILLKGSLTYLERQSHPHTELITRLALLQVLDIEHQEAEFGIETAKLLFTRFTKLMRADQRDVAVASLGRIIERYVKEHPEIDSAAWKAQHFATGYPPGVAA